MTAVRRRWTGWAALGLVGALVGACGSSSGQSAGQCAASQPSGSITPTFSVTVPDGWHVLDLSPQGLDEYATAQGLSADLRSWLHTYVQTHEAGGMTWFATNLGDPRNTGGIGTHAEADEFTCVGLQDLGALQAYTTRNRKADPNITSALAFTQITLSSGAALRLQYTQTTAAGNEVIVQYEVPVGPTRVYEFALLTHPDLEGPADVASFDGMLQTFQAK